MEKKKYASQARASSNYQKRLRAAGKVKQLNIQFREGDFALLEHANKQPSTAAYIKELIRRDMEG